MFLTFRKFDNLNNSHFIWINIFFSFTFHRNVQSSFSIISQKNSISKILNEHVKTNSMLYKYNSPFRPTPLVTQSKAFRLAGFAVLTTMCCISLQVKSLLASRARAHIPAAKGADADVPVWLVVQRWCRSVVTTCFSPDEPEL